VVQARATLTRRVSPFDKDDLKKIRAAAAKNGFTGEPLQRHPFTLTLEEQGSTLTMQLSLPIEENEISRIFAAPAAMSSESMAHWLPKLSSPIASESFELELRWEAVRPARAAFLNWQLVAGALNSHWRAEGLPQGFSADAGPEGVSDPFTVTLVEPSSGGRIAIERQGAQAHLRYTLITRERR
jgi:hypothetical protein